jgi:hypothetical protein
MKFSGEKGVSISVASDYNAVAATKGNWARHGPLDSEGLLGNP